MRRNGEERRSFHDDDRLGNEGTYEGAYDKDGKKHGKGVYRYPDGAVYEGDYINDKRNGGGKYVYSDGDVYEGDWHDNMKNGRGKYVFSDGDKYEGDWKDSFYHGKGIMTFANGDVYNGEYQNGRRNGKGMYRKANGTIIHCGEWRNGNPYGPSFAVSPSSNDNDSSRKNVDDVGDDGNSSYCDLCMCCGIRPLEEGEGEGKDGKKSPTLTCHCIDKYALLLKYLTGS